MRVMTALRCGCRQSAAGTLAKETGLAKFGFGVHIRFYRVQYQLLVDLHVVYELYSCRVYDCETILVPKYAYLIHRFTVEA
jgi:hypothetical protein